ncbi:MAG: hypothetical protein HFJ59_01565 [Clostridia bacterium]|nr:hypothetical protein [Clostridia bacterium]
MGIIDRINKRLNKKNPEKIAKEIAKTYVEIKEKGEENPIDTAVEKVMNIMKEELSEEDRRKTLKELFESNLLPKRVVAKTAIKISESEELPDEIITSAISSSENVHPEIIGTIIEEGSMDADKRIELMQHVEDEEIIEKHVESELELLYDSSRDKTDREIIDTIENLINVLGDNSRKKFNTLIEKVISKKMAENYYSDTIKSTRIYGFSEIIPVKDMIDNNLPAKVKKEFEILEGKEGHKIGRFSELKLRMLMFNELSKQEDTMRKMLSDNENKKTLAMLENLGVLKRLNSLPEEQRATVIEKIGESLEGVSPEISEEKIESVEK